MIEPRAELRQVVRVGDRVEAREALVCLDKNERVDPLPPEVLREMLGVLRSQDLTGYPVLEPFAEEVAAWLGVPPGCVLLTSGSDPAIRTVFEVYARPGDVAVTLDPTFAMYRVYAQIFGTALRGLPYDDALDLPLERVLEALGSDVRVLFLPNPNSPTGTVFREVELEAILARAHCHDVLVLVDEAYHWFTPITAFRLVERFDNLVVTRTFSKAGGLAGVRLGFMVSQARNIDFLRRVKPMYEISALALRLGQYLVRHDEVIHDYARRANAGRDLLSGALAALGLRPFESHANFVNARVPSGTDVPRLVELLRTRGFLIKGGFLGTPLADCIRVSTASPEALGRFLEAFHAVWPECRPAHAGQGAWTVHAGGHP